MALSTNDLFRLEVLVRRYADRLRKKVERQPGVGEAMKMVDAIDQADSRDFDMIGDIFLALQEDWPGIAPAIRDRFKRASLRLAPPEKKAEPEADAA